MRELKVGDVLKDLEASANFKREIFCLVAKVEEDRVYTVELKREDKKCYPHNFRFNEKDCMKLSFPLCKDM